MVAGSTISCPPRRVRLEGRIDATETARGPVRGARAQYRGGGSPASTGSGGLGQVEVFEPQHVFVLVSQHCTPPASAGQVVAQSLSVLHDGAHVFSAGVDGVDGGSFVSGAGSVGSACSSAGTSALLAQAAATAIVRRAVTARADFEKVTCCTGWTLRHGAREVSPDRLTFAYVPIHA